MLRYNLPELYSTLCYKREQTFFVDSAPVFTVPFCLSYIAIVVPKNYFFNRKNSNQYYYAEYSVNQHVIHTLRSKSLKKLFSIYVTISMFDSGDNMKKIISMFMFAVLCNAIFAQYTFPHHMTEAEERDRYLIGRDFNETQPPASQVRPVAEFEQMSAVIIAYPLGIPMELINALANDTHVIIAVENESTRQIAETQFIDNGINMNNCEFLIYDTNSYWTRDFGPFFIMDSNNEIAVVDFPYNRTYRPLDNDFPPFFAASDTLDWYGMDVIHTGGNYMNDGVSTGASSDLVLTENTPLTELEIKNRLASYLGTSRYFTISDPNNTYIDHIDCWGKFLAPDKILLRTVSPTHAQYQELENTYNFFQTTLSCYGTPYRIFRVNTDSDEPYTNSLILNKNVYVPLVGTQNDSLALEVYRMAMPGYNVQGFYSAGTINWRSTDALHCRTHEVPDKNMLYIGHLPQTTVDVTRSDINIDAEIIPLSGYSLHTDSLLVYYKTSFNGAYQSVPLTWYEENDYRAVIPAYPLGTTIYYYIHAADMSGRSENLPIMGSIDPFAFTITNDIMRPVVSHTPDTVIDASDFPYTLTVNVSDDGFVSNVLLEYKTVGIAQYAQFVQQDAATWTYTFDTPPNQADSLFYRIHAADNGTPPNFTSYPETGFQKVYVNGTSVDDNEIEISSSHLSLYPNPFSAGSSNFLNIAFSAKDKNESLKGDVKIYNIKGQLIRTIEQPENSIVKSVQWNGKDEHNKNVSNGIYLIKVKTNRNRQLIKKMVLLK